MSDLFGSLESGIADVGCDHTDLPHTVWWWIEDPNDPVPMPYSGEFDNRKDALDWAMRHVGTAHVSLRWIKIFRSNNEMYTCWMWKNPTPSPVPAYQWNPRQELSDRWKKRTLRQRLRRWVEGVFR